MVKLDQLPPLESGTQWKENILLFSTNNIIVNALSKGVEFKEHWGPLSIKCAFNGTENYYSKNFQYQVNDSNYLVFNEGRYYGSYIESETAVRSFTIHLSPDFVKKFFYSIFANHDQIINNPFDSSTRQVSFSENLRPHDNVVSPILFRIKNRCEEEGNLNNANLEEEFSILLNQLVVQQNKMASSLDEIGTLRESTKKELMRRLTAGRDYIVSNYKSDIGLDDISSEACLNKFYFLRNFNKTFRSTPHQYLLQLRMTDAARQLKSDDKSITDISHNLGFQDLSSFSRLFKKYYKISPQAYKNHFQAKN